METRALQRVYTITNHIQQRNDHFDNIITNHSTHSEKKSSDDNNNKDDDNNNNKKFVVSEELQALTDMFRSANKKSPLKNKAPSVKSVTLESYQMIRQLFGAFYENIHSHIDHQPTTQIKEVKLENFWYELTGVWVIPQDRIANRTIYYIHGGGWSFLQPKNMLKTLEAIAIASKSSVFAIDYRKAPEFPFPTGLSDCVLGYKWLLSQPGVDSKSTIIAGDSAGGNLTLTTTISLINDADPSLIPAGLICISPVTNAEANFPSIQENKKLDPMLNISVEFFQMISYPSAPLWSSLSKFPLISPYHASLETLRKFPPVQIWVAEGEVLRDDSIFMSEKLKSAGVDVDLRIGQNVLHVYPCFLSPPESVHARSEMAKFINRVVERKLA